MSMRELCHIVGCDGCGKSTIIKHLKNSYPATYIHEPYHQNIIDQINESSNTMDKINLFALDRHLLYKSLNYNSTIISDRSFICSMVYQSLELESQGWPSFQSIKHIYQAQLSVIPPTIIFYIYANPLITYNRLQSRDSSHHLTTHQIVQIQSRYSYIFDLFNLKPITIDTSSTTIENNVSKIISNL